MVLLAPRETITKLFERAIVEVMRWSKKGSLLPRGFGPTSQFVGSFAAARFGPVWRSLARFGRVWRGLAQFGAVLARFGAIQARFGAVLARFSAEKRGSTAVLDCVPAFFHGLCPQFARSCPRLAPILPAVCPRFESQFSRE